jgi:hypothetical protein
VASAQIRTVVDQEHTAQAPAPPNLSLVLMIKRDGDEAATATARR